MTSNVTQCHRQCRGSIERIMIFYYHSIVGVALSFIVFYIASYFYIIFAVAVTFMLSLLCYFCVFLDPGGLKQK